MAWTCEQTEGQLLDAMEGTLDAVQKSSMDRHVAECPRCAQLARSVGQTVERLHGLEPAEPPAWLAKKIIASTAPAPVERRRRLGWLDFTIHPRFLVGALAVLVTFTVVFRTLGVQLPTSFSEANPVQIYRQFNRRAHLAYARGVKFLSDLRVVYEIQSRFEQTTQPTAGPEPKGSDPQDRLFYQPPASQVLPTATHVPGDKHELRQSS